jgi:pimeloyl-ACP methyl ester carboxylesterase
MTTWVLLRGWMRETRHWGEFPLLFHHAIGTQYPVLTLDFPGNGALHALTSPASVEAMADYCHLQLTQSGHSPPYCVLALSLGAMAAVAWNERYPGELERLVLINTSLAHRNPFYHRLRPATYPALLKALFRGSVARRENLVMWLTSNIKRQSGEKQAILKRWIAYAEQYPPARANMLRQLSAAAHYRAAPAPPSVPVLLLAAQRDRLVNVKATLALAQEWGCPLRLHPTAGHDLPLDDGEWVARQVTEWLNLSRGGG